MPTVLPVIAGLAAAAPSPSLHPTLSKSVQAWAAAGKPATIDDDRATGFAPLAAWIAEKQKKGEPAHLVFVCTHNSRRSQLGQAWAKAAALELGLTHVSTWSGGTEATAFNPRAVAALRTHGFQVDDTGARKGDQNIVYRLGYGENTAVDAFSKVYSDAFNPRSGFAAVMVCSAADASCPFVEGAEVRVSVPYLDPKVSDGTPEEAATYLAKSTEIGHEMTWLMQTAAAQK